MVGAKQVLRALWHLLPSNNIFWRWRNYCARRLSAGFSVFSTIVEYVVRIVCLLLYLTLSGPAAAEFRDQTFLMDVYTGSARSALVEAVTRGGYELADGTPLYFEAWYTPRLPDISVVFMTEVSEKFGLIWGLSTGERGEKYRIAPAVNLGFILQKELFPNAVISFSATTTIGGRLSERTCTADYGIFGKAQVNCRLAATDMRPDETLSYLLTGRGRDESRVVLSFNWRF